MGFYSDLMGFYSDLINTIIMIPRSPIVFSMMVSDNDILLVGGFNQLEKI